MNFLDYLYIYVATGVALACIESVVLTEFLEKESSFRYYWVESLILVITWPVLVLYGFYYGVWDKKSFNPVVKMILVKDLRGYWLVDRRGNRHAFGSAERSRVCEGLTPKFSSSDCKLQDNGQLLFSSRFNHYGDLENRPHMGKSATVVPLPDKAPGYYIFTEAGEVFAFGAAEHFGSLAEVDPIQYNISWDGWRMDMHNKTAGQTKTQTSPSK